jgi:hypothetical protein
MYPVEAASRVGCHKASKHSHASQPSLVGLMQSLFKTLLVAIAQTFIASLAARQLGTGLIQVLRLSGV